MQVVLHSKVYAFFEYRANELADHRIPARLHVCPVKKIPRASVMFQLFDMYRWGGFVPCLDAANLTIRLYNYASSQCDHCLCVCRSSMVPTKAFGLIAEIRQLGPANVALDHWVTYSLSERCRRSPKVWQVIRTRVKVAGDAELFYLCI